MKIINTANNKVLANIITNHRMSIEEALEAVGIDLRTCDNDWIEDCEEVDED